MASLTVLILIIVLLSSLTTETSRIWKSSVSRIRATEAGRFGYNRLAEFLSQATLNTYWDYDDAVKPTNYLRQSELQFLSGSVTAPEFAPTFTVGGRKVFTQAIFFSAPLGKTYSASNLPLDQLLNGCGYFIEYCDDRDSVPAFLAPVVKAKWRFRLREWIQPVEEFSLYGKTSGVPSYSQGDWINLKSNFVRSISDNIIAMVVSPCRSNLDVAAAPLTEDYFYNSRTADVADIRRHQLPPLVAVTLFILDEDSAVLLESQSAPGTPPAPITTALTGLFQETAKLATDTATLGQRLSTAGLKFRTVMSSVSMRGSKWSE